MVGCKDKQHKVVGLVHACAHASVGPTRIQLIENLIGENDAVSGSRRGTVSAFGLEMRSEVNLVWSRRAKLALPSLLQVTSSIKFDTQLVT